MGTISGKVSWILAYKAATKSTAGLVHSIVNISAVIIEVVTVSVLLSGWAE